MADAFALPVRAPRLAPRARFALWLALLVVSLALAAWHERFESARPFAAAVARGTLIVAVPSRPEPTLYVGKVDRRQRAPDPFAAALANDLAQRAGLPVELLLADSNAARAAVATGHADVAIAGLGFAPDASLAFAPTAYATGRGLALVLRHGSVQRWDDLRAKPVCAASGDPYAARAAHAYHANVQGFDRPLDALLAFQAGDCAALVADEYVVRSLLKQPDWMYYRALPGSIAPAPAYVATRSGDAASTAFVEHTVTAWRRDRWLATVRAGQATNLAFDMFNAENDLYCH
ncbi:substrate-binding periplasmic protein [Paraburkholderia acidisoli]|uniref:Transporter substrate-binding domain-containing protein n=1 Tax=Paraburkholderia acidisoli TaxID=2571748 RepID=A0A7Z2GP04_9BURK|nr:transporter substrate-binding domain-containing protein [Paraburkholderia acidisoli]QGZ65322.1 transporter substrate-binding domain-containing protein [Paraburkholderia acidisoli]